MKTPPQPSTPKTEIELAHKMIGEGHRIETIIETVLTTHSLSILKALEERYTAKVQKRNGRTSSKGGVANIRRKARNRMLMDALTIAKELLEPKN